MMPNKKFQDNSRLESDAYLEYVILLEKEAPALAVSTVTSDL